MWFKLFEQEKEQTKKEKILKFEFEMLWIKEWFATMCYTNICINYDYSFIQTLGCVPSLHLNNFFLCIFISFLFIF